MDRRIGPTLPRQVLMRLAPDAFNQLIRQSPANIPLLVALAIVPTAAFRLRDFSSSGPGRLIMNLKLEMKFLMGFPLDVTLSVCSHGPGKSQSERFQSGEPYGRSRC
jgi:hypothetical protein